AELRPALGSRRILARPDRLLSLGFGVGDLWTLGHRQSLPSGLAQGRHEPHDHQPGGTVQAVEGNAAAGIRIRLEPQRRRRIARPARWRSDRDPWRFCASPLHRALPVFLGLRHRLWLLLLSVLLPESEQHRRAWHFRTWQSGAGRQPAAVWPLTASL